jgi:hypothetical protein
MLCSKGNSIVMLRAVCSARSWTANILLYQTPDSSGNCADITFSFHAAGRKYRIRQNNSVFSDITNVHLVWFIPVAPTWSIGHP